MSTSPALELKEVITSFHTDSEAPLKILMFAQLILPTEPALKTQRCFFFKDQKTF